MRRQRPTTTKDAAMRFRMPARLYASVLETARARGMTASDLLRDAVSKALDVCPSCGRPHVADTAAE